MCGRVTRIYTWKELWELYELGIAPPEPNFPPSFNVAPSTQIPALTAGKELRLMRWGLVPFWAKGIPPKYHTINAKAETVDTAASYRGPWKRGQRCILPVSGFYEWQVQPSGPKQPFYIRPAGEPVFHFGGLWDSSVTAEGTEVLSCTIVTMPANELMAEIHNDKHRMPLILEHEDVDAWLSGPLEEAKGLIQQYPSERMRAHPVSTRVNSPRNNDPSLVEPV